LWILDSRKHVIWGRLLPNFAGANRNARRKGHVPTARGRCLLIPGEAPVPLEPGFYIPAPDTPDASDLVARDLTDLEKFVGLGSSQAQPPPQLIGAVPLLTFRLRFSLPHRRKDRVPSRSVTYSHLSHPLLSLAAGLGHLPRQHHRTHPGILWWSMLRPGTVVIVKTSGLDSQELLVVIVPMFVNPVAGHTEPSQAGSYG
jgi:hypothetical protein